MENKKFGLIGKTLKHSYSKVIHEQFNRYDYDLYSLESDELKSFLDSDIRGFNVTIPYKKQIIEYLTDVQGVAKEIGAVNTVVKKGKDIIGYNTDFEGMKYMLSRAGITITDKVVMVLGSGGTSNTAVALLKSLNAKKILIVSRTGEINYSNCYDNTDVQVIINTTPVGMYPNTDACPIDLERFSNLEGVADVIYNPSTTKLLFEAKRLGIKCTNGLPMLVAQAKFASDLFVEESMADGVIEKVLSNLEKGMKNILFIGMPGCGKSTIAKKVATLLGRELIDTDQEIEKREGKDIPTIFATSGEKYFRAKESQVLSDVCSLSGKVIATGGGVVENIQNKFDIVKNSIVFYIKRDIKSLSRKGRPLSKDLDSVKELFQRRKPLYEQFCDIQIDNDSDVESAVNKVIKEYENFSN